MHQSIKAGTAVEVVVVGKLRDCSSRKVSGLTQTAVFALATLKAPLIGAVTYMPHEALHTGNDAWLVNMCLKRAQRRFFWGFHLFEVKIRRIARC
jgi:hypothetical protein